MGVDGLRPALHGRPRVVAAALCGSLMLAVLCLAAVSCGKKGPPLTPLMRVPGPVGEFSVRRFGDTVYVRFVVPTRNQDNSTPADVNRVDVYAYTGKPASDDDIVKYGTLVAGVAVRRPPRDDEDTRKARNTPAAGVEAAGRRPADQVAAAEEQPGFDQGATVILTETLTPELMKPVVVPQRKAQKQTKGQRAPDVPQMPGIVTFDDTPSRVYVAVGVNRKGRRGIFSPRAAVPVVALPAAPSGLHVTYTEKEIVLGWTPPPGAPPIVTRKADDGYLRGRPIVPVSAPAWFYDVFEEPPAAAVRAGGDSGTAGRGAPDMRGVDSPASLNRQPLSVPAFSDERIEFGVERCYVVRTVNVFGNLQQESKPSEPVCVTPRDRFAPEAPRGLIAVSSEGVISLSWDPNSESDLAGYVVLRGEDPAAPLRPMNDAPIQAPTFEDKTVKTGVRYVYAVIAIDKATPPNVSKESNRIEETAR